MMSSGAAERLAAQRRVWAAKPVLADIYRREFFDRLVSHCVPGTIVEVGGGPGFFKEAVPDSLSFDIVATPWADFVADGQRLPLRSSSIANLVCTDVFHHLSDPVAFLAETGRVLRPGGRLVMVEPWASGFSRLLYTYCHEEDFDLSWQPGTVLDAHKDPFAANQAIPAVIFGRCWDAVQADVPALRLLELEPFSLFAYLLSLGFQRPNLLPRRFYPLVARFEDLTRRAWAPVGALRALIALERR